MKTRRRRRKKSRKRRKGGENPKRGYRRMGAQIEKRKPKPYIDHMANLRSYPMKRTHKRGYLQRALAQPIDPTVEKRFDKKYGTGAWQRLKNDPTKFWKDEMKKRNEFRKLEKNTLEQIKATKEQFGYKG